MKPTVQQGVKAAPPKASASGKSAAQPSSSPSSNAASLTRIRDNQRRSRARRKEYLQELEDKFRKCEQQGVEASHEMQQAAKRVLEENQRLRAFLRSKGIDEHEIDNYSGAGVDGPGASVGQPRPQLSSLAQGLESLIGQRRPCCTSEVAASGGCNPSSRENSQASDGSSSMAGTSCRTDIALTMQAPASSNPNSLQAPSAYPQTSVRSSSTTTSEHMFPMGPNAAPPTNGTTFIPSTSFLPSYPMTPQEHFQPLGGAPEARQMPVPVSASRFQSTPSSHGIQQYEVYPVGSQGALQAPTMTHHQQQQQQQSFDNAIFYGEQFDSSDLLSSATQEQLLRGLQPEGDDEHLNTGDNEPWKQGDGYGLWHRTESPTP